MTQSTLNVFGSIRDFLNPANWSYLPLVRLPDSLLSCSKGMGVSVFAKTMYLTPLLNVKLPPAFEMFEEAEAQGRLSGVKTIVEASSGNMTLAFALLAPCCFGVPEVLAIVPADMPMWKREMLRLAGVVMEDSKDLPGEPSAIQRAKTIGQQAGYLNLAQYENRANPAAHAKLTAAQTWQQLDGKLTVFAAGLGTTGTAVGARDFFRQQSARVTVVGGLCAPGNAVPGVRSEERLKEIGFDWRNGIEPVEVTTKVAYRKSRELVRSGIPAGPSSGLALAALDDYLGRALTGGDEGERLRNADGDIVAVVVCGDTYLPYLDKYSTILDPQDFR